MRKPEILIPLIQQQLSPELLKGRWKEQTHPLQGHCYVAAEVLWYLLGCKGWTPVRATYTDTKGKATHWWLRNNKTKAILDPTAAQFLPGQPPYHLGVGSGFLTRKPSARAAIVITRVKQALSYKAKGCIGDCRNEQIIREIFGSVQKFSDEVEENGNEFTFFDGKRDIEITYNPRTDIHTFWPT